MTGTGEQRRGAKGEVRELRRKKLTNIFKFQTTLNTTANIFLNGEMKQLSPITIVNVATQTKNRFG